MPVCTTCGTHYGATVRICVRDGTPLVAGRADDPYLGKLLDDKYRIDSFISSGGMGAVYRAEHVMLGKTVAVKVIRSELVTSPEVVARFQREARAASNLDHPNIVTVYDLGQAADGTLYIAMEFIDGPSLRDALRREGPMPPERIISILRQVASALSTAHRRQIVHRDLKSHNLMLATDDDGREVVKLVDFGIAKTFDEAATQWTAAGYMLGTPHYMSPEQAAGKEVDHRADIYSLGVILYEMLTGAVPFADDSLASVLVKLATEVPERPSARRTDITVMPELEAVAMRCLEKDPAARFQSADEFAAALDPAARGVAHAASAAEGDRSALPPVAGAAPTLIRPVSPAPPRAVPAPGSAAAAGAAAGSSAGAAAAGSPAAGHDVPAARVRSGFSMPGQIDRRAAVVLVMLAAIGAAIASGVALTGDDPRTDSGAVASGSSTAGDVAGSAPRAPDATEPSSVNASAGDPVVSSPSAVIPASPPEADGGGGRSGEAAVRSTAPETAARTRGADRSGAAPDAPGETVDTTTPGERPQVSGSNAAAASSGATAAAQPSAGTQAPARAPSIYVGCEGFPDVCSALRAEMTRAFQRDGLTVTRDAGAADIQVAAVVDLVDETTSAPFGTPITTRTYSVELDGTASGASLVMPDPRRFSFDPRIGAERLAENARLIAADAAQTVRTFRARTQP